jgi:Ca2+:H+ antiporter
VSILLRKIAQTPLLWLLVFVPVVLGVNSARPEAQTLLFLLSILAVVPLAALLSLATESVAERTGDAAGGLINATLGNLTELVIAVTALSAGQYALVKASIAGAIVTNTLFMLGACLLLGGLRFHAQSFNLAGARLQASLLFIATIALLVPSTIAATDTRSDPAALQTLSLLLAILLIGGYVLGLVYSLGTHRQDFASADHEGHGEALPIGVALVTLGVTTVFVALVSHIFVASVEVAGEEMGLSPAFVGFIVVSLVGGAAEFASAFSAARKDRLDLSLSIALGSASQIALFVAPVLVLLSYVIGPQPMGLDLWPGAAMMLLFAALSAALLTAAGQSTWFLGVLVLMVYAIFAITLYVLPPLV